MATKTDLRDSHEPGASSIEGGVELLLALEGERPRAGGARYDLRHCDELILGRGTERCLASLDEGGRRLRLELADDWLSKDHLSLQRAESGWLLRDLDSRNGVLVAGERCRVATLEDATWLSAGHSLFRFHPSAALAEAHRDWEEVRHLPVGLRTLLPVLARRFEALQRVAFSRIPVLLHGPTGCGKELVARAIHEMSEREGPLVPVNCGALTESLLESQLFGHQRGAFSGATESRPGLVRSAHNGTLFLDEIGDLPLRSQVALLRVLQEREVTPVGATRPVPVDIRVIAASHRDLDEMVRDGLFREDLYARLRGYVTELPPLAERIGDLGGLVASTLERLDSSLRISPQAAHALVRYDWPRNIRELAACIELCTVLAEDDYLVLSLLPEEVRGLAEGAPPAPSEPAPRRPRTLGEEDLRLREELTRELERHQGNVAAMARATGRHRTQLYRDFERLGINLEALRS